MLLVLEMFNYESVVEELFAGKNKNQAHQSQDTLVDAAAEQLDFRDRLYESLVLVAKAEQIAADMETGGERSTVVVLSRPRSLTRPPSQSPSSSTSACPST